MGTPKETAEPPAPPADDFQAQLKQLQQKYLNLEEQLLAATKNGNADKYVAVQNKLEATRATLARLMNERRARRKEVNPAPPAKKPVKLINPIVDFWGAWGQAHDE